jgi:hypothetical protein
VQQRGEKDARDNQLRLIDEGISQNHDRPSIATLGYANEKIDNLEKSGVI